MSAPLEYFTFDEAARIIGGEAHPHARAGERMPQEICSDSRDAAPNKAFVCIRGSRVDGHDFIGGAVAAGASAVITEKKYFDEHRDDLLGSGAVFLIAPDCLSAERAAVMIARAWMDRVAPTVIGITGSVGKTTTREFLAQSLSATCRTHTAKKSYNTLIGCAMTIAAMPKDTEVLILELGANHKGEIAELVDAFPIDHAIITEVSPAHLEGFGTVEGVCAAKMEIVRSRSVKSVSYNDDNSMLRDAVASCGDDIKKISVGTSGGDVLVSDISQQLENGEPRLSFRVSFGGRSLDCTANVYGEHNARNIALAFSAAREAGADIDELARGAAAAHAPNGRGDIERLVGGTLLIDDTYNANPDSMSQALRNALALKTDKAGRRIAVLGGMRELGASTTELHELVLERAKDLDEIHLIGAEWDGLASYPHSVAGRWASTDNFIASYDFGGARDASLILLKGSRYYALERAVARFRGGA